MFVDHERKSASTAGSSPVSSPKTSRSKQPRAKTEKAICKIGAIASILSLGKDFSTVAKNMNDVKLRSGSRERRKSPNARRSREISRKSWFGSSTSSETTDDAQRDSIFGSKSFLPDFRSSKRPESTPVLKSISYVSDTSYPTSETTLIDFCEIRDRRSKSLGAYELNEISIPEHSSISSTVSLTRTFSTPDGRNGVVSQPQGSPPPLSPRTGVRNNEINSNHFNKHFSNVKGPSGLDGQFVNIVNGDENQRQVIGNGKLTERERLTLLDVNVDGQHEDRTKPLITSGNIMRKPLTIQEIEKDVLH